MSKKLISEYLPFLTEEEIASIHTSLGNDIEYVIDEAERKALTEGVVGVTRSVQANLLGIIWTLVAADETLDASWIAQPYSTDPDGTIVINMELADFAGIVPDANVFGQVGGVPSIGNGVDTGGNKVAMLSDIVSPAGIVRVVSTKTSNISVTVRHDGTESATGICYSVDGGTPVYGAIAADTATILYIPHNGGAPVEIYIWSATSASSGKKGELTNLAFSDDSLTSLDVSGLTALTYLACPTNNLTSLDVSGLTALTTLSFGGNQLTSLDVSGLTALTSLYFDDNNLTSLDVSGLTALTTLSCRDNSLTSLDVSGLTALTLLSCNGNALTSLLATDVDLSHESLGWGSEIHDNLLTEAALIAFVDSLETTATGVIAYGTNTGSAAFETWLATGDDKGYIWINNS